MPKWSCKLTIKNNLDRPLEMIAYHIPWGKMESEFPNIIKPKEKGHFNVYSPAGVPSGIEFYISMADKPINPKDENYGLFNFRVDMPFWHHENKSSFNCTGMLKQEGYEPIEDGVHDYAPSVIVYSGLNENIEAVHDTALRYDRYDWSGVRSLSTIAPKDVVIDNVIPKKNTLETRKAILRTDKESVPKKMWNQIKDAKFLDEYSKRYYVNDYFTAVIYEIRKNIIIPIAANQSYSKRHSITNESTIKHEVSKNMQIDNTISAESGENPSLSVNLRYQYQINDLKEYCNSATKTVEETFEYEATNVDRTIVLWDLAKVLVLYRVDKKGNTELLGIGDYYLGSYKKTYTSNINMNESDIVFECANSQELYSIYDEDDAQIAKNSIQGLVKINNVSYKWREYSFSDYKRGILFNPGNHKYVINPNPHENNHYRRNARSWYDRMAAEIESAGNRAHWTKDDWSREIRNLNVYGENYTAVKK